MTGASKILTVSYGTFSCTLEGFDDPFNTMKAIAEYFRDLAADDRYFGAEPPTPDAAMLHRIAEREIHRRVEAKIQDNGVILRAGDSPVEPAPPAPTAPALALPGLAEADATSEGVAARLQRIRERHAKAAQPVSQPVAQPAPAVQPAVLPPEDYSEDEHAEDLIPAALAEAALPIEVPDQLERILDAAEAPLDAPSAETAEPPASVIDLSDEFSDLPEAEDFDITSLDLSDPAELAAPAPAPAQEPALDDDDVLASIASELASDQLTAPQPAAEPAFDPAFDAALDAAADSADLADEATEDDEDPALMVETLSGDDDSILSRLSGLDPTEPDDAEAPKVQIEDPVQIAEISASELQTPESQAPESQAPAAEAPVAPVKPQKARARVIRIRRVDPAAQAQTAEAQPAPAEEPAAAITPEVSATSAATSVLSDEAEAALQAELAALEAELGADLGADLAPVPTSAPAPAAETPTPAQEPAPAPRHPLTTPAADESLNRLMEQANTEMGGEESRRRQAAIAHLKAAVVATAADGGARDAEKAQSGRMEAYRSDLDRVVRPRRPVSDGASTARPDVAAEPVQRPTPLVLVSAQRIDRTPQPAAASAPRVIMPVRPRRVSGAQAGLASAPAEESTNSASSIEPFDHEEIEIDEILAADAQDNVFADATSFQDFADQLGASALPDLLEAAAVYCAEVLQRPEFSRPLVMRQLASLPGQSATAREDYLRGFGTLLRQGRISKVKRGMFALTDRSPYLAEARKQAG